MLKIKAMTRIANIIVKFKVHCTVASRPEAWPQQEILPHIELHNENSRSGQGQVTKRYKLISKDKVHRCMIASWIALGDSSSVGCVGTPVVVYEPKDQCFDTWFLSTTC